MDEKFFVNKDYEAYNIYLSIRAHFHGRTGKGFDIKNSNYTANMPFAKYQAKSAIVIMFKKLTEKFQRQEVIDIIVSNFANGDKFGGQPFDSNAIDVYKDWKSRQNSQSYIFKQDLESILERMDSDKIEDATVGDGHPLILKMLLGKLITLETVVILNRELDFIQDYADDLILKDTCLTIQRYTPFVDNSTKRLYLKHLDLINKIARTRNSSNTMLI